MNKEFVKGLEIELRRGIVEYNDLMNDFEFVKELNKVISLKYQDFVDSIPKPKEVDIIIENLTEDCNKIQKILDRSINQEKENKDLLVYLQKRIFQLKRFRSAAVILEKDDPKATPDKYEDLFNGK